MKRGFILDKRQLHRWSILTLFSGNREDDIIFLELEDLISVKTPNGDEEIDSFSFSQQGNDYYLSGNFNWGSYFEYNILMNDLRYR